MKKQTKKLITAAATVFVILSVCLFAGKNSSESARLNTDTDETVVALTEEKEAVDGAVQRELSSAETEETAAEPESEIVISVVNDEKKEDIPGSHAEKETDMPELSAESSEESAESNPPETVEMISAVVQESTGAVSTEEQKTTATDTNTNSDTDTNMETGSESTKSSSTEESSSENYSDIDCSGYGIYGDTGERFFYRCDKEKFWYLILKLGDPQWYRSGESQEYYEKVFALSKRYTTEHPFSEGSILKPYFQNIEYVFPFSSDYGERKVVVKAYDTLMNKKYFRIHFTVTDKYELDTVTVEELSDDDIAE